LEEALKAAVDRGRNEREERDTGFREMKELMRERDKERGLHRGQLESMASQVDSLSGLVRKVEEERDEAMCKLQHQALASNQKLQEELQKAKSAASSIAASAVSVEQVMANLRMITLNLDRDFDAWKAPLLKSPLYTIANKLGH
jgi:chromosome segregation ATPase